MGMIAFHIIFQSADESGSWGYKEPQICIW